ncbi:MAG: rRNA maturation RNase YbeY [Anaerolineae bacterium]
MSRNRQAERLMSDRTEVDVQIGEAFAGAVNAQQIEQHVTRTLSSVAPDAPASLAVTITDDTTIQTLNRDYLGIDAPTDVLAFSQVEGAALPAPAAGPRYLGDVIVSYERAVAQAAEYGEPVERELGRLVIHGTLHLLGYDDQHAAERDRMWNVQESIVFREQ